MPKTTHHLRSAPIAIAAILALGSTSALAQTAPASPAPSAPSDPIVLQLPIAPQTVPSPAPTATVSRTPVVQPVDEPTIVLDVPPAPADAQPEPEQPAQSTRTERAAEPEPAPRRSKPAAATPAANDTAPVAATASTSQDAATSTESALPADAAIAPLPEAAAAPDAAVADPVPNTNPDWAALIALALVGLIPIGLAIVAFAWFRRRSRRAGALEIEAAEREAEPVAPLPVESEPEPVVAPVAAKEPAPAPTASHPLDSYRGVPNSGAAVALPEELPQTFEERDALLKRMIAAKPDRANPFRSTKARAKRARLILQSLGRKFDNVKPRIDLSEYTANWPALARKRTAYA